MIFNPYSVPCCAEVEWWAKVESESNIVVPDGEGEYKPLLLDCHGTFAIPCDVPDIHWNDWAIKFVGYMYQKEPKELRIRIRAIG